MKKLTLCLLAALLKFSLGHTQSNLIDPVHVVQPVQHVVYETEQTISIIDGSHSGPAVPVEMDVYRPLNLPGETNVQRPVVLICHGILELKDEPRWIAMGTSLARRGFVAASINYRLDPDHFGLLLDAAGACGTLPCKTAQVNRMMYCNAMDIHKAITYFIANQTTYQIDPNRFILLGHSMGSVSSIFATSAQKLEFATAFPSSFLFDSWYTNFDLYHSRIKGSVLFGPAVPDLNVIDAWDNLPAFLFSGTHDPVTPFYSGRQLCLDETNPTLYGGAAIAQRVDAFFPNQSYFFLEARGVGHTMHLVPPQTFPNPADDLQMLYFPDMLRFMRTTILDGYPNQIHKQITPINTSIHDYCDDIEANPLANGLAGYFNTTQIASGGTCYSFPFFFLTTQPWNGPAYPSNANAPIYPQPAGLCGLYLKQGEEDAYGLPAIQPMHSNAENDASARNLIVVFPNPTSGNLQLTVPDSVEGGIHVRIVDLMGNTVLTGHIDASADGIDLDVSAVPLGAYLLECHDLYGHSASCKFIRR